MSLLVPFAWPRLVEADHSLAQDLHQPIHALVNAFAIDDGACNDTPIPVSEFAQLEGF